MFSSNLWSVIFIVFFLVLVSTISVELGLTTTVIDKPASPQTPGGGILDSLTAIVTWTFNTIGSFIQLLTFQADLPPIINTLIMLPLSFGLLYLIVVIVRGGAG